jgi:vacuolar iron transporter family protein
MTSSPPIDPQSPRDYPAEWLAAHIQEERRHTSLLAEIREVVFGAQDGLVSTLTVVAAVAGATSNRFTVLVAGLASAVAGVFSMAVGEYMGSKSQAEIFDRQVAEEWEEVQERPMEAEAEVAHMFVEEGMDIDDAWAASAIIARNPRSLLATMVAKEIGIVVDDDAERRGTPLRGALFMGGSFALGSLFPLAPFLFSEGAVALIAATLLTAVALFSIGAVKSQWTHRSWLLSGLEIVTLAGVAGGAGYLFGSLLPHVLGFAT